MEAATVRQDHEVLVDSLCYRCATPYSGGDRLDCPVCAGRKRREHYADPFDLELYMLRLKAARQKLERYSAPQLMDDGG